MADAVENAAAICCFLTPKYQDSEMCIQEFQYAMERKVKIVPCRLCANWKPSGALGFVIAGRTWIDFRDTADRPLDTAIQKLIDHLQMHVYDAEPVFFPENRPYNRPHAVDNNDQNVPPPPVISTQDSNSVDVTTNMRNAATKEPNARTNERNSTSSEEDGTNSIAAFESELQPNTTSDEIPSQPSPGTFLPSLIDDVCSIEGTMRFTIIFEEPARLLLPIEGYQDAPLLPLAEAIRPVEHLIDPHIKEKIYIAKRNCEHPEDGLTQDESASIQLYSMEASRGDESLYYVLNEYLRHKDRRKLIPFFAYLKLIFTALWKLPSHKGTVWRGVRQNISDHYKVGEELIWWGFSSCTDSLDVLQSDHFLGNYGPRTLFNIECYSGKIIRNHSFYGAESEILLLPATRFLILGKMSPASDLHIIQLREIEGPFPLLKPPFAHQPSVMPINYGEYNEGEFDSVPSPSTSRVARSREVEEPLPLLQPPFVQQQQQPEQQTTTAHENQPSVLLKVDKEANDQKSESALASQSATSPVSRSRDELNPVAKKRSSFCMLL
ncbi:unnamed protein product [Rotaria sp. Silwood2]|nr:unnamed protein product [Rotaria sp. Silwood2]CAF4095908.1 unnamed protein product [Rotaria sp. Silwood2]